MPDAPHPLTFLAGLALGFLARPLIMGCFQSKSAIPVNPSNKQTHMQPPVRVPIPPTPLVYAPQQRYQASHPTQYATPAQQTPHQPVLNVPRPNVTYGDRERAELKAKNMRDDLQSTISRCETVLSEDAKLALRLHKQGHAASARVLIHRRQMTRQKIGRTETLLKTVMEMIDSMDQAKDNVRLVEAMEDGTRAINDIMSGLSKERVQRAVQDNRDAIEYTREIARIMGEDVEMADDDFENAMEELEMEMADGADVGVQGIPQVPTEMPVLPVAQDREEVEEVRQAVAS